jgi:outer membrane murein-binding lipoprotein Lpp
MEKDKIVKKPLIAAQEIQEMVKRNTEAMMKDIISESVKIEMRKMITEDEEEKKYEEEDVEDVTPTNTDATEETEEEEPTNDYTEDENPDFDIEDAGDGIEDDGDDWSEVDEFRVDDNTYDLTNANEEDIVKVYKLATDDDQVLIVKNDDNSIEITDKESGNSYLVKGLDGGDTTPAVDDMDDVEFGDEDETVFEIDMSKLGSVLKEDNLGYTTKYQGKTAMTTPAVSPEPSPVDVNDWDNGVPTSGDNTQRFGKPGKGKPFEGVVTEDDVAGDGGEDIIDEAGETRTKSNLRQRAGVKSKPQIEYTDGIRVDGVRDGVKIAGSVTEQKLRQLESEVKSLKEKNGQLKEAIKEFKTYANDYYKAAQVAGITNYKMGKIVKLFTEHSTTLNEKKTIVERFEKETKTTAQINDLYESIKSELDNKKVINENGTGNNFQHTQKINENKIYVNDEVRQSIDFMNRLNNV